MAFHAAVGIVVDEIELVQFHDPQAKWNLYANVSFLDILHLRCTCYIFFMNQV